MAFGGTLGEHLMMAASANMFYIAIDYKSKVCLKVAASNINIKIHQLFFKQPILGARAIIVQQKISGDLEQICF